MIHELTGRVVQGAKPLDRPYEIRCTKIAGLLLRVQPSGVKSFIVEFTRGKRRTIGRAGILTLDQARITAQEWLSQFNGGKLPPAARGASKALTLGEFINKHYSPWVLAERRAGAATLAAIKAQFEADFYPRRLDQITAHQVDKFKAARLAAGIKPATVNRDLVRIRACIAMAVKWGFVDAHPLATVKKVKGDDEERVRYLTSDEEKRLRETLAAREAHRRRARASGNAWNAARGHAQRPMWPDDHYTDHVAPLVLVAINTGLRRGELFKLSWKDVDLEQRVITVRAVNAKSKRTRRVPLNDEALQVLKACREAADADARLVFPGDGGAALTNINRAWSALIERAKITDLRFHDLRHSFASKLVMAGASLYVVKELLGHQDIKQTERYSHLAPEAKSAAVALLVRPAA